MKKFILLGGVVFLFSMLALVPANVISNFLPSHIAAKQFEGNLWQGSASSLVVNNTNIGHVSWKLHSGCLLLLKICADIDQRHADITSSFILKARQDTELYDVKAYGNTAMLSNLFAKFGIKPSGTFEADLPKITFVNEQVETIEGNLQLNQLVLNGVLRVSMGNVDSKFEPKNDHTYIAVRNDQGHVDMFGSVQLFTDMSYQVDMKLRKNENSTDAVINGLKYVGKSQSDGSVRLQQNGKLTI